MRVRNRLGIFLQHHGLSLLQLSKEINANYTTLNSFYKERHSRFNADLIAKLCARFDCEVGDLIYLEDETRK